MSPGGLRAAGTLPVTVVTAIDAVLRDTAVMSAAIDVPDAVVVRHDLDLAGEGGSGTLRRVVSDATGLLEDVVVPLEHACLSCALREDLLPTLVRLDRLGRWGSVVLALPVGGEPLPVVRGIGVGEVDGAPVSAHVHVGGVVAIVDGARVVADLTGGDSGDDDGALGAGVVDDELVDGWLEGDSSMRAEALAHQLRSADLVLATGVGPGDAGPAQEQALALLRHLVPAERLRLTGPGELPGSELLAHRHEPGTAWRRDDPRHVCPTGAADGCGVWTLDLHDWRPMHPRRLRAELQGLAAGWLVARGRFWLPTRPSTVGIWDAVGGQLSIGEVGDWDGTAPSTRLVVTGIDEDPRRVEEAFARAVMTEAEVASGIGRWAGRRDGFDGWMGRRSDAA